MISILTILGLIAVSVVLVLLQIRVNKLKQPPIPLPLSTSSIDFDRKERDLVLARITIMRLKLEKIQSSDDTDLHKRVQTILDEDNMSRKRPLEDILAEAVALRQASQKKL